MEISILLFASHHVSKRDLRNPDSQAIVPEVSFLLVETNGVNKVLEV